MGLNFDRAVDAVNKGKSGLNVGLSNGYTRINDYIYGVQKSTYYLVGGETSTGKTAFTDSFFVFGAYEYVKDNNLDVNLYIPYYSMEISVINKIIKGVCRRLYFKHNILVDVAYVLSKGKNRISDEIYNLVVQERDYFEGLEDCLRITDKPPTSDNVEKHLRVVAEKFGTFEEIDNGEGYKQTIYKPNGNNYILPIFDHYGLLKLQEGQSKKNAIDATSKVCIKYRNLCGFSPILVSQFNRNLGSTDRAKIERLIPQLSDFKETGDTSEDADVVIGLFNPSRYNLEDMQGYQLSTRGFSKRFRSLHILKNRDGDPDIMFGMKFLGEIGQYSELPIPTEMTPTKYHEVATITKYKDEPIAELE